MSVFAADDSFVTAFGKAGVGPGQFHLPTCICVDNDGRILIGEHFGRVQVFGFCRGEAVATTEAEET